MMATSQVLLTPLDYAIVGATLIISLGVGIHHGFNLKSKSNRECPTSSTNEYFLAGRSMSLIPVALSFFATTCSTLAIIGPAMEVYGFGLMFFWVAIANIVMAFVLTELFVPIFYNMRSINIYKFFEVRYSRRLKQVVTLVFTLRSVLVGSVVIYGTSVSFNQVTNLNLWLVIVTVSGVCVIYTTLGGIRGVMWADVFQGVIMLASIVMLFVVGVYHVGGPANIWNANYESGRLDIFVFDFDLVTRHTFWADFVGMFIVLLAQAATSQSTMHRFLTAPSIEAAKKSSYLGCIARSFMILVSSSVGCIMYAEFYHCDPLTAKTVQNMNQLVPKFVSNVLGPYPILPGLFFAGLLSAGLSTLSSVYNSLAAILMDTFIQPWFPKAASNVSRLLGMFVGILTTVCVLITARFPNVVQATISSSASVDGPLLGILLVGVFCPQAKLKVAAVAFFGAIFTTLFIVAGTLAVNKPLRMKPMFTDGCLNDTTTTFIGKVIGTNYSNVSPFMYSSIENRTIAVSENSVDDAVSREKYFPLHDVTYQWLAAIGLIAFNLLFLILSAVFGKDERSELKFDPADFIPKKVQQFQRRLPRTLRRVFLCDVYEDESENGGQTLQRDAKNETALTDMMIM